MTPCWRRLTETARYARLLVQLGLLLDALDGFHCFDLQNADNDSATVFFLQGLFLVF